MVDSALDATTGMILEASSYLLASVIVLLILAPILAIPAFFMFFLYILLMKYAQGLIIDTRVIF